MLYSARFVFKGEEYFAGSNLMGCGWELKHYEDTATFSHLKNIRREIVYNKSNWSVSSIKIYSKNEI